MKQDEGMALFYFAGGLKVLKIVFVLFIFLANHC